MTGTTETPWAAPRRDEDRDDKYPRPTTDHEIEVILARQLASYLAFPIVIVDPAHIVIYYNEPAEHMLGRRFDEGGPIPVAEWSQAFHFTDDDGKTVLAAELPLAIALRERRPAHRRFWLRGLDGVKRCMEERAIPLINVEGRFLGAMGIFSQAER